MNILDQILEHKTERELPMRKRKLPLSEMRKLAQSTVPCANFAAALTTAKPHIALIAEVKRASPSKGDLAKGPFDPVALATTYAANGASAISVLTDENFFKGSLAHLRAVRAAVSLPLLRKDFNIDEYQIHEARANGADAILLIVAALNDDMLEDFLDIAHDLELSALVEVHDERDLERALQAGAKLIGVNNRDLRTFNVDLQNTQRVAQRLSQHRDLPPDVLLISESGIASPDDVKKVAAMGAQAVLVGESLIVNENLPAQTRAMAHVLCTPPAPMRA